MKRLTLVALALAALVPATGHARAAVPRPGLCLMVPAKAGSCSYPALMKGTIAYAIQGAVEYRVTHAGVTTRTCMFGSGGGTGPSVAKGDRVDIVALTGTTSFFSGLVSGGVKPWVGTGKRWPC
jgi:hypothetical protein